MRHPLAMLLAAGLLLSGSTAAHAELNPLERLGKSIYFDKISAPDRQACADCHAPESGFTGPSSMINAHGAVVSGAIPTRFGNRKPPSAAYATTAPLFQWDPVEGLFFGGNFWDGRATGAKLGNPAADQALGPFLNPVEMNNTDKRSVLQQIATSRYARLWFEVWGSPIRLNDAAAVERDYDRIGLAIAAFEASNEVNAFTSKFDYVEQGKARFTQQEAWGKELFEGKANCAACHMAPFFTDYTYDNIGTPKNPANPFYAMDQIIIGGQPVNPQGASWVDPGLGGFLATLPESFFGALGLDKLSAMAENLGKQKVPTLRNVDKRPYPAFQKAFMHNGSLKSLKEVVHFYNTRDTQPWPLPEVMDNVNHDELGNLGLTDAEEDAVVAFLKTLSDGFVPRRPGHHHDMMTPRRPTRRSRLHRRRACTCAIWPRAATSSPTRCQRRRR
jgi:cytochrome c peroxidase